MDETNELLTSVELVGTNLVIKDAGNDWNISLASLVGTDDQNITDFNLTGTILTLTLENGNTKTVELADLNNTVGVTEIRAALAAHILVDEDTSATNELQNITSNNGSVTIVKTGNDYDLNVTETVTTLSKTVGDDLNYTYTNESGTETTFRSSPIVAFGKVDAAGALQRGYGATVAKTGTGTYNVTLVPARSTSDYTIQLSIVDANGAGRDAYDAVYSTQTTTSFVVEIGDNDNGGSDRQPRDLEFMFTVMDY
jgi:hypothetical protein